MKEYDCSKCDCWEEERIEHCPRICCKDKCECECEKECVTCIRCVCCKPPHHKERAED
ncbi:MAG: hypothetical protein ACI4RM_04550 [Ruminococcus sp.]